MYVVVVVIFGVNVTSEEKEDKPRIGLNRGADFPFVLSLY